MDATSATILGCNGLRLTASERDFFAETKPWGFILFARNVQDKSQLKALTDDLRAAVGYDAPILIDQEGGRVQRMRGPIWREWRPALDQIAAAGRLNATRSMWLRSRLIAYELLDVGIDVNCVPLADVARDETHPVLLNRLYGHDVSTVSDVARAVADAHMAGGVLPVLKHLPGYGLGTVDSHHELPSVAASRTELDAIDFKAFRPLADLPMGMTAHIVFSALGHERPATMDPEMIDLIRQDIGFQGALMTDDLSMNALPGDIGSRAFEARQAGCDLILHCNGNLSEMQTVVEHAGPLSGEAAVRTDAALGVRRTPEPLDIDAVEAELSELLDGEVYA